MSDDLYPFVPSDPTGECLRHNGNNAVYEEIACLYPKLGATYANWETGFDAAIPHAWMEKNFYIPFIVSSLYLVLVYAGQKYFSTRDPLDWRDALSKWNLFLFLFSLATSIRCWPQVFHNMRSFSLEQVFCFNPESSYASGSTGCWCFLFAMSKTLELFDTMFIVVHKKKLTFLHVFHHAIVELGAWHSYITRDPTGILAVCFNATVHTAMYFYYYLMSIKAKGWIHPKLVTWMQLTQFGVGMFVTSFSAYVWWFVPGCAMKWNHVAVGVPLVAFFLYLFASFYFKRYNAGKKAASPTKKDA